VTGVSLIPILLWLAALACAGVAIWREGRPILRGFVIDRLLRYLFLFPVGIQGLWAFVGHVFFAEQAAASIGWATSPFQYEVGVANLGIGLAAIYAAFRGFEARLAVTIAVACFLIGAGIGHIRDIIATGNLAPGNAGPIMVTDFLTPIALLVLLFFASAKWQPRSAATLALEAELENARKAMRDYRDALSNFGKE
jgi:Na+/melibiose symporter-like transporter